MFRNVVAFDRALGTGIIISSSKPISQRVQKLIRAFIDEYECTLSRFREDSLVSRMARAEHGGEFEFPLWVQPLFAIYDEFYAATHGAFDACVGADLLALGYDNSVQFVPELAGSASEDSGGDSWANYRRSLSVKWGDISRDIDGCATLCTNQPVQLDFGAAGKGYFVDLLTQIIKEDLSDDLPVDSDLPAHCDSLSDCDFLVNAGGDMRACFSDEDYQIKVALENPFDMTQAVGVASIASGALCASSSARKRWKVRDENCLAGNGFESNLIAAHLINALDGIPVQKLSASWAYVPAKTCDFPTAYADALATALFVSTESDLQKIIQNRGAEFAVTLPNHTMRATKNFPAQFFVYNS